MDSTTVISGPEMAENSMSSAQMTHFEITTEDGQSDTHRTKHNLGDHSMVGEISSDLLEIDDGDTDG